MSDPKVLLQLKELKNEMSVAELKKFVEAKINASHLLKLEYLEIADENTLIPLQNVDSESKARAFIAVKAGEVRLIDNVSLNF